MSSLRPDSTADTWAGTRRTMGEPFDGELFTDLGCCIDSQALTLTLPPGLVFAR